MDKFREKTLIDCLAYLSLRSLPKKEDGENYWIRAVALIEKSDGTQNYAYVEKNDKLENRIVKDFGSISSIKRVVEYYPFSYLTQQFMPKFKTQKKEERIVHLTKNEAVKKDYSSMSLKELDKEVLKRAVARQLAKEKHKL